MLIEKIKEKIKLFSDISIIPIPSHEIAFEKAAKGPKTRMGVA